MDHEVDPDSKSLNGLFDSWIHSIQTLKKMDVRQVDGKIVLLRAPTMQGNDGPFVFNEMRQMPSPEAEAKIRELRKFVNTFGPTFDAVRSMASKLDDIGQAWRELKTDVNRIVSAQGLASMPDEVLSNIFILAQRSQVKNKPKLSITISQVCRRFREVAIGTPSLWNLIAYKMPEEMALTFLERSGVVGLHVIISEYWKRSQRPRERDEADKFFGVIHPYMGRIARLDINIDDDSPASRLLAFMVKDRSKKGFPRLEDLRINYHEEITNAFCPADVLLGGSVRLPSIRNITIGSNCRIPSVRFRDNMTEITVELLDGFKEPSLRRLLTLLETSKSLKDVTLVASLSSFGGRTFQTPTGNGDGALSITSFTLITKCLSIFNDETFRSFIRACRFPNVTSLFIKASISDPDCCWPYPTGRRLEELNKPREREIRYRYDSKSHSSFGTFTSFD
ncbi:hypothetical protein SCHPADRAFT_998268 [Schizopora paradoxa]|uniref:F-box domain-containing protein n=1 Tax=Schizopora paradoxa TaxID=27342 RepID=A0A0H2RS50_9AGAM|nr:hypothetical protein SCHPADRAFT_998268 [Schizopora paradoxa]